MVILINATNPKSLDYYLGITMPEKLEEYLEDLADFYPFEFEVVEKYLNKIRKETRKQLLKN